MSRTASARASTSSAVLKGEKEARTLTSENGVRHWIAMKSSAHTDVTLGKKIRHSVGRDAVDIK